MKQPIIVALNGAPGSGKSAVQETLSRHFGLKAVDDGALIRQHCMELFGLTKDDVSTQSGKKRHTEIQGVLWENRKILGEYGAALEATFGDLATPNAALGKCFADWPEDASKWNGYSFGSVRRGQGEAYNKRGGIVIEIDRPGVEQSGNIWDRYDQRWVNYTFINDSGSLEALEEEFVAFFTAILDRNHYGRRSIA